MFFSIPLVTTNHQKILFSATGFCGYEDEYINHIDCLNNSYYPNAYATLLRRRLL